MPDPALQLLLDPASTGRGIIIADRVDAGAFTDYYVTPHGPPFNGRSRWVRVTTADSDAQKNTAIRAALLLP